MESMDKEIWELKAKVQRLPRIEQLMEKMSAQLEDMQQIVASLVTKMATTRVHPSSSTKTKSIQPKWKAQDKGKEFDKQYCDFTIEDIGVFQEDGRHHSRLKKVEMPISNGENPGVWSFRAKRYF